MWCQGPWTGFRLVLTLWSLGSLIQVPGQLYMSMCIGEPVVPLGGDKVSIGSGAEMVMNTQENRLLYSVLQYPVCTAVGHVNAPVTLNLLKHKKIFFKNNVYGASDPEPPKKHPGVSCVQELASGNPSWIKAYQTNVTNPDDVGNEHCYYHSTQNKPGDKFVGRCTKAGNDPWSVSHLNRYKCFKKHPGGPLPPYEPPIGPGGGDCTHVKEKCKEQINITRTIGISANSKIGKYVWGYRISHGIAMCFSAMIIIPTGTLFARFFKETYMSSRFINIHIWHGIHISSALMGFSGLFSGIMAATIGRFYFGYSWHIVASLHAVFGWLSVILYLVSIGSAPFRRFSMMPRKVTIFGHFFLGSLTRFLFTICLLTSFYISASPAGQYDVHINVKFEPDIALVLVWIVVDVAIHLLLQLQMLKLDKVKPRKYVFGVPIPNVRPSRVEDSPNTTIRKLLLLAHVVVSVICTFGLSLKMCMRDPAGRRFGKMTYTHKSSGKLNLLFSDSMYDGD